MRKHALGQIIELPNAVAFFGDGGATLEAVRAAFPRLEMHSLKQTHSDIVVDSASDPKEADAHFTQRLNTALCIRTADCLPVLICTPTHVAAIHAGWRGVASEIIIKACAALRKDGAALNLGHAVIGPHIQRASFEVGGDVAAALAQRFAALGLPGTVIYPHRDANKAYVDLLTIARAQLIASGLADERLSTVPIDTFTSPSHASFRRDGSTAGRQISFIYRQK